MKNKTIFFYFQQRKGNRIFLRHDQSVVRPDVKERHGLGEDDHRKQENDFVGVVRKQNNFFVAGKFDHQQAGIGQRRVG